eukprot:TRINITY_DN4520_c0_g1_i1.p1 TRINITY_DN4520_c0_g1~~TRINITY_DN4520_c0_g1_i1.p1  ORF type:complete len:535 (-),score=102.28 TRINITY_DN4520_c0_g1_i1:174-1778(-)
MSSSRDDSFWCSPLQEQRLRYQPQVPPIFTSVAQHLCKIDVDAPPVPEDGIRKLFPLTSLQPLINLIPGPNVAGAPLKVGVVLSGGPAPGGHNVISGIFDYLKSRNTQSQLFGFLGGPKGVIKGKFIEISETLLAKYRNQGGFDIIGTGRDKIETPEDFKSSLQVCSNLQLDGLVVVGGDDSNTNAALLAEYFLTNKIKTKVIGTPKTIDGDLKSKQVEVSFGFDSATKVYSSLIANIATDANSSLKYYHFIRLMGRSASHITLECALQTHPNIAFIGEEVEAKKKTLKQLTSQIVDVVVERAKKGINHGVILIPEGLIEFIPEVGVLIRELNEVLSGSPDHTNIEKKLTKESASVFALLPKMIQEQLLLDRDPHGNVQVSRIETETLLASLVAEKIEQLKANGSFKGSFNFTKHFFGYEGRCVPPTNFDSDYCYVLGKTAGALIELGKTGLLAIVRNLTAPVEQWRAGGLPLTSLMDIERRKGKNKPVIKKALVELDGPAFKTFVEVRDQWAMHCAYRNPGRILEPRFFFSVY